MAAAFPYSDLYVGTAMCETESALSKYDGVLGLLEELIAALEGARRFCALRFALGVQGLRSGCARCRVSCKSVAAECRFSALIDKFVNLVAPAYPVDDPESYLLAGFGHLYGLVIQLHRVHRLLQRRGVADDENPVSNRQPIGDKDASHTDFSKVMDNSSN
jgi:hypothetical protein